MMTTMMMTMMTMIITVVVDTTDYPSTKDDAMAEVSHTDTDILSHQVRSVKSMLWCC